MQNRVAKVFPAINSATKHDFAVGFLWEFSLPETFVYFDLFGIVAFDCRDHELPGCPHSGRPGIAETKKFWTYTQKDQK